MRCRSDRQAGQAKQHAQIAHTEVTLSGLSMIRKTNLYLFLLTCDRLMQWLFHPTRGFWPLVSILWGTKELQYHSACLFTEMLLIKKKEQRMNYCQRSRRVLILAVVQIYSTQEQSTLRNVSESAVGGSKHETKLTKHWEMYNIFHFTICITTLLTKTFYSSDSFVYWTSFVAST